jgi:hypothetical protein
MSQFYIVDVIVDNDWIADRIAGRETKIIRFTRLVGATNPNMAVNTVLHNIQPNISVDDEVEVKVYLLSHFMEQDGNIVPIKPNGGPISD